MLTYRTGAAGAPSAARAMADHLLEQTLPQAQAELAAYYQRGVVAADPTHGVAVAEPRRDMDPGVAALLGIDPNRAPEADAIAQLLAGNRADGTPIPGKQVQRESQSLAELLGLEPATLPHREQIAHILDGQRADGSALPDDRAAAIRARFLALYGFHARREPTAEERDHLLAGQRADGSAPGRAALLEGLSATRSRIGYVDLCWSADKTVSLAWAFAPTAAERAIIAQAHHDAVDAAMRHVESEIGRARKGKAGREGFEPGRIGWVRFDHYASRPTVEVPRRDAATGEAYTELVTLKVAGDPQLHTHVAVPNAVLTESGRVGGLDLQRLEGRVHEWGALYQAHLATNLRRHGIDVALDAATGAARITAVPDSVRAAFSKRTMSGTESARAYAAGLGLDWDSLDAERRIGLAKRGVQGDPRQAKQDDLSDWAAWRREATALGWRHESVLRPEPIALPAREARLEQAYETALGLLDRDLQRRAVVDASMARVAAARGLIASGVESAAEIDDVVRTFARRGVRQDGQAVGLIWGQTADAQGRERVKLTTTLHVERETEFLALARDAAADRSGALGTDSIAAAVARSGRDFSETAHGRAQRDLIDRLGQGGRLAVAIGVAGAGKSTVLAPLVDAWQREGRRVYGAALAWRQSDDLAGAGIAEADRAAFSVFLARVAKGQVRLDRNSVVVVDELGLLGTRQALELLRVQAATGCQVVAVGDPKQCQSIEAGPVIELLRRALGTEAVPELLTTVRQQSARERETCLLFREGQAAEALALKRTDGTAQLVPGGYREAVEHVATLWAARRAANAHDPDYTLTVSAPSNADARAIGAAIRERRRDAKELGPDQVVVDACDQSGVAYALPLAVGDRVRLFARTNAAYPDHSRGIIGNNGSVLDVRAIDAAGVTLRNAQGREGLVAWDTLRDQTSGRIRLSYGDVLTIDATQGLTSAEHIQAMPAGTQAVTAYKAYTAASRHRRVSYLVTSDGAERREIAARRPLGDPRPIREADVWANMGRNLARQPETPAALDLLERAHGVQRSTARALQAGLQPAEQREAEGLERTTLTRTWQRRRVVEHLAGMTEQLGSLVHEQGAVLEALGRFVPVVREVASRALVAMQPVLHYVVGQMHERPRQQAVEQQHEEEEDEHTLQPSRGLGLGM
ncbi:MAG TPA: MobF family relaxase [Acetobacteraceae bacterium]|nr:MobF family relaxase [Acetobacteraceae bacterium]